MHDVPGTDAADDGGSAGAATPPAPEPSHAERCRTLVAGSNRGALSTLAADPAGYPYGSVASFALDDRGNPLFLISLMAEHTQNAIRDPRGSLLVTEPVPEGADPLASGRVTLLGPLTQVVDTELNKSKEDLIKERDTATANALAAERAQRRAEANERTAQTAQKAALTAQDETARAYRELQKALDKEHQRVVDLENSLGSKPVPELNPFSTTK